jgi:hypothetical protein
MTTSQRKFETLSGSSKKIRRRESPFAFAAMLAAGLLSATLPVSADEPAKRPPSPPAADRAAKAKAANEQPAVKITLDTSEVPDMASWAAKAKELCEKNYPMICRELASDGFKPPTRVKIVFRDSKGIAYTSGTTITCCKGWFKAHPEDYGAVIHEMCHVVQSYRGRRAPSWVTEGIADYVRWFIYEPANHRPHVNPRRAKYTDSYQTTAAFLDWIARTKDKTFVKRMNAACREGRYKTELFAEYAGKPLDALWDEFIAAQK